MVLSLTEVKRDSKIGISCLIAKMERGWRERKKGKLKLLSESAVSSLHCGVSGPELHHQRAGSHTSENENTHSGSGSDCGKFKLYIFQ